MLWTIGLTLLGLWAMGLISGGTQGAWIHLFLAFAVLSLTLAMLEGLPRRSHRG